MRGRWSYALQSFQLIVQGQDNRFANNRQFNNRSGNGELQWNWALRSVLTGQLGGDYSRSLVNFASTRDYRPDYLEGTGYFATLVYHLGPQWRIKLSGKRNESNHSLDARATDNFIGTTATGGVEYETPSRNVFGWDYRYTEGRFPDDPGAAGQLSVRAYDEQGASGRLKYAVGAKTVLEGSAGYLRRDYPQDSASDFSGDVWRVGVRWSPTVKVLVSVSGWRELRANQDVESDYFVSTGGGVNLGWSLTESVQLSGRWSRDSQRYLLASGQVVGANSRRDTLENLQVGVVYQPREWLELNVSFANEQRDSNRDFLAYDDQITSAGVKLSF
ncbi:MAG: outer membrane beta-barrel protein [Steroidobacteraceae bacterium]